MAYRDPTTGRFARAPSGGGGDIQVKVDGIGNLRDALGRFAKQSTDNLLAIAEDWTNETVDVMKATKQWQNRTWEAYHGLVGHVYPESGKVTIVIGGMSNHNYWLEVAMGRRYAIIAPTMENRLHLLPSRLASNLYSYTAPARSNPKYQPSSPLRVVQGRARMTTTEAGAT